MSQLKVFLSHSHKDSYTAKRLFDELEGAGTDVFLPIVEENEAEATPFEDTIEAIKTSEAIIVLITPASVNSPWLMFEIGAAWSLGKRIIPIVSGMSIEDALQSDLPSFIKLTGLRTIDELSTIIADEIVLN